MGTSLTVLRRLIDWCVPDRALRWWTLTAEPTDFLLRRLYRDQWMMLARVLREQLQHPGKEVML